MDDCESMLRAIELAKQAAILDEVPVGAVVTHNGVIVGEDTIYVRIYMLHPITQ